MNDIVDQGNEQHFKERSDSNEEDKDPGIDYSQLSIFNKHQTSPPRIKLRMPPKVVHGIALSTPHISQVAQMQLLQLKQEALQSQNKTERDFINQYLKGDYTRFLKYPQLAIVRRQPPTQREHMISQILKLRGFNPNGSPIVKEAPREPQPKKEEVVEERIATPKQTVDTKALLELQGDFFRIRNDMCQIRGSMSDIKTLMSHQVRMFESKQNLLNEQLRKVIELGGTNQLKAAFRNGYDRARVDIGKFKEEKPSSYQEAEELIETKLKENEINRHKGLESSQVKEEVQEDKEKDAQSPPKQKRKAIKDKSLPPIIEIAPKKRRKKKSSTKS